MFEHYTQNHYTRRFRKNTKGNFHRFDKGPFQKSHKIWKMPTGKINLVSHVIICPGMPDGWQLVSFLLTQLRLCKLMYYVLAISTYINRNQKIFCVYKF